MRYPNTLRQAREAAGMSPQELADAADISRTHVGVLEAGRSAPSLPIARRVAAALKTTPEAIWSAEEVA